MDLEELVKRAKAGDQEALVQLVMAKSEEFYRLAYVYMGNKEDVLDAMEDMIVLLFENIRRLKNEASFYSWSKTILVNCCHSTLRKQKKVIAMEKVPEGSYQDVFTEKEEQSALKEHWAKLSERQQEVLKLRFYLDLDYESIARILNIPLGTVKSRIHTGLRLLQRSIGGEWVEQI
ncbi:RNA polymerase sigma factor [Desulfosporosinus sp. BG]|uniref:RNA polymerase sigma factor n=1 Tax=Desulfosporosinus sp. BG TaxID=1633135 RepID=UPI00083A82CB|nr:RNA polymerase sigma factor [Desulfosporosinus sp. BG]ODA40874.1 RNA polymerase sigma factor [Desulfosporosinus sp. BG]